MWVFPLRIWCSLALILLEVCAMSRACPKFLFHLCSPHQQTVLGLLPKYLPYIYGSHLHLSHLCPNHYHHSTSLNSWETTLLCILLPSSPFQNFPTKATCCTMLLKCNSGHVAFMHKMFQCLLSGPGNKIFLSGPCCVPLPPSSSQTIVHWVAEDHVRYTL